MHIKLLSIYDIHYYNISNITKSHNMYNGSYVYLLERDDSHESTNISNVGMV